MAVFGSWNRHRHDLTIGRRQMMAPTQVWAHRTRIGTLRHDRQAGRGNDQQRREQAGQRTPTAAAVVDLPPDAVKDITTPAEPAAAAADQPVEAPIAEARPDPVPEAQATLSEAPMPPQGAAVAANQAEPEPSSPMPPPAPAAARPSLVLPVMAGLVAGLIGGVATSQLLPVFPALRRVQIPPWWGGLPSLSSKPAR